MKVSLGVFYRDVTGTQVSSRETTIAALNRWGIPFKPPTDRRGSDAVDIIHLEAAKKLYAAEKAAIEARRAAPKKQGELPLGRPVTTDTAAIAQNTRALQDLTAAIMLLVEKGMPIDEPGKEA